MAYHFRGKHGKSGPLEGSSILKRTICQGNMEKVGHLRVRQFLRTRETWKKWATWVFVNFKAYHLRGKHGKKSGYPLEGSTILRRTICEGNMEKVGHLRVRQFYGVPFARETWKKWATWGFDNFKLVPFARETWKKWATWGFDNFRAYHLRGKYGRSGPLEGSTILRRTICEGNMEKVGRLELFFNFKAYHLRGETWKKWATWGFHNFKAYHLRGKHGKSGPLEGSTILGRTICEGNMEKVGHLRVRQF